MTKQQSSRFQGIIFILLGLLWLFHSSNAPISPIFIALGVILATANYFKSNHKAFYIFLALVLVLMLVGEYFLAPVQNITLFYVLIAVITVSMCINARSFIIPEDSLTKKEKVREKIGVALYAISLFSLAGIIYNNFEIVLFLSAFMLILIIISLLIRRKRSKKVFNGLV